MYWIENKILENGNHPSVLDSKERKVVYRVYWEKLDEWEETKFYRELHLASINSFEQVSSLSYKKIHFTTSSHENLQLGREHFEFLGAFKF